MCRFAKLGKVKLLKQREVIVYLKKKKGINRRHVTKMWREASSTILTGQ